MPDIGYEIVKTTSDLLAKGYDRDVVTEDLQKLGYSKDQVGEIFSLVTGYEKQRKSEQTRTIFLAVAGFFIVLILGMALYAVIGPR
jgi:hypothetical protein